MYPHQQQNWLQPGAVTAYIINISTNVSLSIKFDTKELSGSSIDLYALVAGKGGGMGKVFSLDAMLNRDVLVMPSDTLMPVLIPVSVIARSVINVKPLSLMSLVFPEAKAKQC